MGFINGVTVTDSSCLSMPSSLKLAFEYKIQWVEQPIFWFFGPGPFEQLQQFNQSILN